MLRRGVATIECITAADLEVAWAIGEAYPDQDLSIADRTSFAVMERLGIHRPATPPDTNQSSSPTRFTQQGRT